MALCEYKTLLFVYAVMLIRIFLRGFHLNRSGWGTLLIFPRRRLHPMKFVSWLYYEFIVNMRVILVVKE
jgi:hypothetical protein